MERLLFVAGIAVLAFLHGAATVRYEIPPYRLIKEAQLGLEAWASVERDKSQFPNAFEKFEDDAASRPQARQLGAGGEEYVLVTGGPYQLMERCPRYGCMAWLTDRSGRIVHSWEVNLDELWKGLSGISGDANKLSLYPVGMALSPDGSLAITFQGRETYPVDIGIVRIDREGRILWKRFDLSHHWIASDPDGNLYTPFSTYSHAKYVGSTAVDVPCKTGESGVDGIRVLSPHGERLRELKLMDSVLESGLRGWFYNLRDGCNPTHLNSVAVVPAALQGRIPGVTAGDLLVSMRETNAIALLDGGTGAVKYLQAGRTAAQHSPKFLPDGTVLVFDNLGGERTLGGSRVVRLNLVNGNAETVFPKGGEGPLLPVQSRNAGHIDVSPDGRRALVSITHQGRIVEIDVATGAALWVYENTHDITRFLQASGLPRAHSRARFATYGAYYVPQPHFLKEPS